MRAQESTTRPLVYVQYLWGDRIEGSKAQLQALGIGVGVAFPGENGANKREMTTQDPRGYRVKIVLDGEDRFIANRLFPNWPQYPSGIGPEVEVFPGVTRQEAYVHSDRYVGTAQSLAAAGLVQAHQFPGLPGMPKVRVHLDANLELVRARWGWDTGFRTVERFGRGRFSVTVRISRLDENARRVIYDRVVNAWMATVSALDRPAPLSVAAVLPLDRLSLTDATPATGRNVVSLAAWREARRMARE